MKYTSTFLQCLLVTLYLASKSNVLNAEPIKISGFARAAFAQTTTVTPIYLGHVDHSGDPRDTSLGLNAMANLEEGWSVAGQIWGAGGSGESDHSSMALDWVYIRHKFDDTLSIDVGKLKYPNLLVSEYIDVGIAYPWVKPPEEVYYFNSSTVSLAMESFEGGALLYRTPIRDGVDFGVNLFAGQSHLDDGKLSALTGLKLSLSSDYLTAYAAVNLHRMHTENSVERSWLNGKQALVQAYGLWYEPGRTMCYLEYTVGKLAAIAREGYYGTLGYRIGKWTPLLTYAQVRDTNTGGQSSTTGGFRFQATRNVSVKVDVKQVRPTSGSSGYFASELSSNVADIVSGSVDVVF